MTPLIHTEVCIDDFVLAATNTNRSCFHLAGVGISTLCACPSTNLSTAIFWILSVSVMVALPVLVHATTAYTE